MAQVDCAPPESGDMAYQDRVFGSHFLTFKKTPAEAGQVSLMAETGACKNPGQIGYLSRLLGQPGGLPP
jgi:hypothetical protein